MSIADNYADVRRRVAQAAERAGRASAEVRIVAASKTWPVPVLCEALDAGVQEFGENRAQELARKAAAIGARARWHFIGHLQSNKVRHVVGTALLVHSVDSAGIAEALARRARRLDRVQDVLIEVNVAGDPSKHGVEPAGAVALAEAVASLDGLAVRGLMTMPPWPDDPEQSRPHYRDLAALRDALAPRVPAATELSMGMTRDFEVAVEEGATVVRIGEAIFGPRAPDSAGRMSRIPYRNR